MTNTTKTLEELQTEARLHLSELLLSGEEWPDDNTINFLIEKTYLAALDACRESITNIETVGGNNLSEEGKLEFVRGYNCANIDQIEAIDSLRTGEGKETV